MTNSDSTHNNPHDVVGEYERAAALLEALGPEVIHALGAIATTEDGNEAVQLSDQVKAASSKIVEVLTEVAGAVPRYQNAQPEENPATPSMIPAKKITPRQEAPEDISLPEEELDSKIEAYLQGSSGARVHLPVVIRDIIGPGRIDSKGYHYIQRRLQQDLGVQQVGVKRYYILPAAERNRLLQYLQLELWDAAGQPTKDALPDEPGPVIPEPLASEEFELSQSGEQSGEVIAPEKNGEDEDDLELGAQLSDEELIGLVARFMGRRPYFTAAQLREHLLMNEAVRPQEVAGNKVHDFIDEFMTYVDEYYYDRGDEVIWMDSNSDPAAVRNAMGGKAPKVKTYVLGFKPRTVLKVGKKFVPTRTTQTVETQGQIERSVTDEQMQQVVDTVANIGNEASRKSIIEILTEPEESAEPPSAETVQEWIDATMAEGLLFRQSVGGYKGVSLFAPNKRPKVEVIDTMDPGYIDKQLDKYELVARVVMDTLMSMGAEEGKPYIKFWNQHKDKLSGYVTYDQFKELVRNLEKDGLVEIPGNLKLQTRTPRSRPRRGSKVRAASVQARTEWRDKRNTVLARIREREFARLTR